MITRMKLAAVLASGLLALGSAASAQQWYITGQVTDPAWSPGAASFAGAGSTVADTEIGSVSGQWNSTTVPAAIHDLVPGQRYEFKLATAGFGSDFPAGDAFLVAPDPADEITFYFHPGSIGDGFIPDANHVYTSTVESMLLAAPNIQFLGSFVAELGGTNWTFDDPENPILTDAGSGATGDGIYGATFTGMDPGSYFGLIIFDPVELFDLKISNLGLANGGDLSFNVFEATDEITILLEIETGRTRIENSNPAANPGPPFFAFSSVTPWGTTIGPDTELTDNGDGTHTRTFTVPTPDTYYLRIQQGVGTSFPASGDGGYPFTTTVANQDILVVFDTNTYTDGYVPDTNIVAVVDATTLEGLNDFSRVQPVGNWQGDFGSTNFNNDVPSMNLMDVGDGLWTGTLNELEGNSGTNVLWKVVGSRVGNAADAASNWNLQIGGAEEGLNAGSTGTATPNNPNADNLSYDANSPLSFKVDVITGRIASQVGSTPPADPDRPAALDVTSVNDWTLY